MEKIKYLGLLVILLVIGFFISKGISNEPLGNPDSSFVGPDTPPPTDIIPTTPVPEKTYSVSNKEVIGPTLEIVVSNTSYIVSVVPGDTVLSVIKRLREANKDFSFSGEEYPGIGFFIDEINGVKNGGGLFWVYYLNDVSATLGISKQTVKEGDKIRWERRVPGDY